MIMDKYLEFCDGTSMPTAVIASASTAIGNQLELAKAANPNSGKGTPVFVHIKVGTAFSSGGSATVAFDLQHAGTNTPASYTSISGLMPTTAVATFAAGYHYAIALPSVTLKRFVRVYATIGTTKLTAGTVDMWIDLNDASR